jgi:hypothetical protein
MNERGTLVRCEGPRPEVTALAAELWGADVDFDSDGNCAFPSDTNWTELTLENRGFANSRVDIDPVSEDPLILSIRSTNPELERRTAELLVRWTAGRIVT